MQYAKDQDNRFNSLNLKIKTFGPGDNETMMHVLTVIKGRALGLSWRELAAITKTDLSTLFDRTNNYLGDMIAQYDFKKECVPEKFKSYYGKALCPEIKDAIKSDSTGMFIPLSIMKEYKVLENSELIIRKWEDSEAWSNPLIIETHR